jgi:enamine deaminase RidA (YjgF/YER057c/UK114 family)
MEKIALSPSTLPPAPGYSQIVKVSGGTTIYIAGQVALDEEGQLVGEGDLEKQARHVFTNLVTALSEAGATTSDLVKIGIYVVDHDPDKLKLVRRVRDEVLDVDPPPASTLLGVERLALPDFLIEADAIAVVP